MKIYNVLVVIFLMMIINSYIYSDAESELEKFMEVKEEPKITLADKLNGLKDQTVSLWNKNSHFKHKLLLEINKLCAVLKLKDTITQKSDVKMVFKNIIDTLYANKYTASMYDTILSHIDSSITLAEKINNFKSDDKNNVTVILELMQNEKVIKKYTETFVFSHNKNSVIRPFEKYELMVDAVKQSLHYKAKKDIAEPISDYKLNYTVIGGLDEELEFQ